jgi:hypothetical protein
MKFFAEYILDKFHLPEDELEVMLDAFVETLPVALKVRLRLCA